MWERSLSLVAKAEVQACNGIADGVKVQWSVTTREKKADFDSEVGSRKPYRYLTFKWSFGGMHMLHMAAQMVRPAQQKKNNSVNIWKA